MATGDVTIFDQFLVDMANGEHDLSADSIKMAYVDNTTPPAVTTPIPAWGAGGTTNYKALEEAGGNFTADGFVLASFAATLSSGAVKLDFDDPAQIATNASNPTDIHHAMIYNDTNANKLCIAAIELGGPITGVTQALTVTPNAAGLATGDQV